MRIDAPRRGEVWFLDLDAAPPARGHEQAFPRPALVFSADTFNRRAGYLAVVLPLTRTDLRNPAHILVQPPEGGVTAPSFILCDQIRSVSHLRLRRLLGQVSPTTLHTVEHAVRMIIDL
ncbi:MAG TPA: type II toxin-antitoxin system PemK/MazF family toxin [Dehalococcoidia bacterium]|nr:type II toxin-antitoxin system PemK/MazF family toxin [Dehalococcoidia bacterium]